MALKPPKLTKYLIIIDLMTEKEFLVALGRRVDQLRKEKGLSFQDLAFKSDFEKSNLVKFTSQGNNINAATLFKIAQALEVEVKELFCI